MTPAQWVLLNLGVCGLLYTATAVAYYFGGRPGMLVAFVGYAIANAGIVWDVFHTAPK